MVKIKRSHDLDVFLKWFSFLFLHHLQHFTRYRVGDVASVVDLGDLVEGSFHLFHIVLIVSA